MEGNVKIPSRIKRFHMQQLRPPEKAFVVLALFSRSVSFSVITKGYPLIGVSSSLYSVRRAKNQDIRRCSRATGFSASEWNVLDTSCVRLIAEQQSRHSSENHKWAKITKKALKMLDELCWEYMHRAGTSRYDRSQLAGDKFHYRRLQKTEVNCEGIIGWKQLYHKLPHLKLWWLTNETRDVQVTGVFTYGVHICWPRHTTEECHHCM